MREGEFLLLASCLIISFALVLINMISIIKEKSYIEVITISICMWFQVYSVSAFILHVLHIFSLLRSLLLSMALLIVLLAVYKLVERKRSKKRITRRRAIGIKELLIPLIIVVFLLPFVFIRNEYYGLGQDEGIYVTEAMELMSTETSDTMHNDELEFLTYEEDIDSYNSWFKGISVYIYIGVKTYSSFLALVGSIFGITNISIFNLVIYSANILILFFICRNLGIDSYKSIISMLLLGLSVSYIWIAKSTLTELILSSFILLFIYFVTNTDRTLSWLSLVSVIAFASVHMSIFTFIPMFYLVYGGLYYFRRDTLYKLLMSMTPIILICSFFGMYKINKSYMINNYRFIFKLGIGVTSDNLCQFILLFSAFLISAALIYFLVVKIKNHDHFEARLLELLKTNRLWNWFIRSLIILPIMIIIVRAVLTIDRTQQLKYTTIWEYIINIGVAIIAISLIMATLKPQKVYESTEELVIFVMFVYAILLYSGLVQFMRDDHKSFYFSRYITPFIAIGILFAIIILKKIDSISVTAIFVATVAFMFPYDAMLMRSKDTSRLEYRILEDVIEIANDSDCVIVYGEENLYLFWCPISFLSHSDVYPEVRREGLINDLYDNYDRVLVIDNSPRIGEDYKLLYHERSSNQWDDDTMNIGLIPFAREIHKYTTDIYVYEITSSLDIEVLSTDFDIDSFQGLCGSGPFAWSTSEEVVASTRMDRSDYLLTLNLGCPMALPSDGTYEIRVEANGNYVGDLIIDSNNNGTQASIMVSEDYIVEGTNEITLSAPLWEASIVNPADDRMIGFPLASIELYKQ